MGQGSSVPLGGRRKSFRSSWRPRMPHRSHNRKGNLSATFNILDIDCKIDLLNVNSASEEELMTLPGVSRADAHSIVEYRQRLGRFKKVEDLALVSGIGADKLARIRPEICVGQRRSPSCASSRAQSTDSLSNMDLKPSPRPTPLVNVNVATVFELQAVPGFTQEIAANVVDYRDTHGNFSNLEQLTKVRGMNQMRLGAVRSRLTLDSDLSTVHMRNGFPPGSPKGTPKLPSSHSSQPIANGQITGHRKTMSVPIKFGSAPNGLAVRDILDVLSACSPRPIVEDHFDGKRKGRPALRLVSWNLSGLSHDKAENPGVKEVICRTILENRFSLIALQGTFGNEGVKQICDELNFPNLRRIKEWKENSHRWHHQCHKGLGFLWDANDGITLSETKIIGLQDADESAEAIHADFMFGGLQVSVINVLFHKTFSLSQPSNLIKNIQGQFTKDHKNEVIVGDFDILLDHDKDDYEIFCNEFRAVQPLKMSTNSIPLNHYNTEKNFSDNIYLNETIYANFTGMSGIVRQGLTHLAIPHNWSWGGPASDHCPVWCELYIDQKSVSPNMSKKC